jgi:hypothetical protein
MITREHKHKHQNGSSLISHQLDLNSATVTIHRMQSKHASVAKCKCSVFV